MQGKLKRFSLISLVMLFFLVKPGIGLAENDKLLYDLSYDEQKSVLSGKTKPNANIYINDLAGSIVADDKGEFEMPVPKGLKVSTVLMLDAEGDTSTDVRYNFEKNTIVTESTQQEGSSSTSSQSSEDKKEADSKKEEKDSETKDTESTDKTDTSETTTKESTEQETSELKNSISSESYNLNDQVEEKRSLIWLWTLLIVLGVIGLSVAIYIGYKKKIEKEEAAKKSRRKRSSKKKHQKSLDDDFEEDLYASLKSSEDGEDERTKRTHRHDDVDLDQLIESELKKSNRRHTSKSRSSSNSNHKKKKKSKSKR